MSTALAAPAWTLRVALMGDTPAMSRMINRYAARGLMLRRTPGELRARTGEFVVAHDPDGGPLVACGGLRRHGGGLAEIVSLAVREDLRALGLGREVLSRLVREAGTDGIETLFARTATPAFFHRLGFESTDGNAFPGHRFRTGVARVTVMRRLSEPATTTHRGRRSHRVRWAPVNFPSLD